MRHSAGRKLSLSSGADSGFTLLEVMIAVAILAISLVSLLNLVATGIGNADYDQTITMATLYAREKIIEGLTINEVQVDSEGKGEGHYERFSWERSSMATVFSGITQIKVTVFWEDGNELQSITITQFIFSG